MTEDEAGAAGVHTSSASGELALNAFLSDYIVRPGLCLNYEVTSRILQGATGEPCVGSACPQRRLCLSRTLRLHLEKVGGDEGLRRIFDLALLEMGNSP